MSSESNPTLTTPDAQRANATAWLLVAALAALFVAPVVTRRGIFLDGLVYATISRNMAAGAGDLWHPVYVGAIATFRDHPPLGFWLESLAFRALGDHWWVEKIYSVLTALVTGGIMVATWRWFTRGDGELRSMAWLPIAMWVALPCWQWTVVNNMLENTLCIFTAAAVYCSLRGMANGRSWFVWLVGAAACIVCAVLTKGPVGLFPLVAPICAGWCFRQGSGFPARRIILLQATLVLLVAAGMGLLLLVPECRDYFQIYWKKQVIASLKGQRETHPSIVGQAHILWEVVTNLLLSSAIAAGLIWWDRRKQLATVAQPIMRQPAVFCLLMGLAASCPVAISPKQTGFYVFPSYPFYVMALALACAESIRRIRATVSPATRTTIDRRLRIAAAGGLIVAVGLSCTWYGTPRRDLREIQVAEIVSRFVPPHTSVDATPEVTREWALLGYLHRNHCISLERKNAGREFRLEVQGSGELPPGYQVVTEAMPRYRLLQRGELLDAGRAAASRSR